MSVPLLRTATQSPPGWRVTLSCDPSRPSRITLYQEISRVTETVCRVSLSTANTLACEIRSAVRACGFKASRRGDFRQLYFRHFGHWFVAAYQHTGRQAYIHLHHTLSSGPWDVITVQNQVSLNDARMLADAIDELLELIRTDPLPRLHEVEADLENSRAANSDWIPEWARQTAPAVAS